MAGSRQSAVRGAEHRRDLKSANGDVTGLFDGFFDTRVGQKIEEESYKAIAEQLGLSPADILVLADNEDERDAAKAAGFATTCITREGGDGGKHPVASGFAALSFG